MTPSVTKDLTTEALRPQLVMTYFPEIDPTGHSLGPKSEEVRQAVLKVDESVHATSVSGVHSSARKRDHCV